MRRLLQASFLCTCISSTLALGCRNSQQCCTPCCYPATAGQPVPAAPTPAAPAPATLPSQTPTPLPMPLVQNGTSTTDPAPSLATIEPAPSSLASVTPSGPTAPQDTPLSSAAQPSFAASGADPSQQKPGAAQALLPPAQQPSSAKEQAAGATPGPTGPTSGSLNHDPAYHRLVGTLDYVTLQRGWVLRYAGPGEEDRYGGSVTLVGTGAMKRFRSGQRVQVNGELVDAASFKPHPAYRVFSMQPVGSP